MTLAAPRRLVRGLVAALVLSSSATAAVPVAGGELRVKKSDAARDCPDEPELAASTLALGKLAPDERTDELTADVELDRDEQGYVARIRSTGRKAGYRELRAPGESCSSLAEATSVALAILFDLLPPESQTSDPPPLAEPSPPVSAAEITKPPVARPAERRTPPQEPRQERRPFALVGVDNGFGYGALGPAVTWHLGLSFRLRLTSNVEGGVGSFLTPVGRTLEHGPGTVSVLLRAGRIDATVWMLQAQTKVFFVGARFGGMLGAVEGSGDDFDDGWTMSHFWLAAYAGPSARLMLGRYVGVRFDLFALVPHSQHRFFVEGVPGVAYEGSPVAGVLEFGPEIAFW
jgi:hypothetical protein